MRRIGLAVVLTLSLLAPIANEAQQPGKTYQIGLLSLAVDPLGPPSPIWQAFIEALRQHNYIEGQNLVLKRAFASGKRDLLQGLANDLVRSKVDVIVTSASGETRAAKLATSTIPIVMTVVADPVGEGLVVSLARPGGNVTGVTSLAVDLSQKSVELLHEIVPSASRFAVIGTPVVEIRHELEAAATHVGTIVSFNKVTGPDDFDPILAQAKKDGAGGIIVSLDALTYLHRSKLVRAALKHRLPGIYWSRDFAEVGGLMSYGANVPELGRHAALYVDKILKGAKPADLPVEEPTKFELIINLKTAKALGLTIPQSILVRADAIMQ